MTRKQTLAIAIACIVLAAILLTISLCTVIAHSQNDYSTPNKELSYWMSMIEDSTLLKNVAIPGAHDAGTCGLSYLAETQSRNTMGLLMCGVRYLDLRVAQTKDGLKIYHGPFKGVRLEGVLSCVKVFLTQNPSETVILDFQHFDGDAEKDTYTVFDSYFSNMAVKNTSKKPAVEFVDSLTLGQCRGKVLTFWGRDLGDLPKDRIFQRNNDDGTRESSALHSYYQSSLNKKSSSAYIKQALPQYIESYKQQGSGLFVLQGQLTDGMLIFGPRIREASHTKKMNAYIDGLTNSPDLAIINIIIRDFVSPAKCCNILQLNTAKGIVKAESAAAYNQMVLSPNA